jgi:hypothetical protein
VKDACTYIAHGSVIVTSSVYTTEFEAYVVVSSDLAGSNMTCDFVGKSIYLSNCVVVFQLNKVLFAAKLANIIYSYPALYKDLSLDTDIFNFANVFVPAAVPPPASYGTVEVLVGQRVICLI